MRKMLITAILLTILITFFWPSVALAKSLKDDKVVFGGAYTLESGKTLDGDLFVIGGVATLEDNTNVNGNVALIGGSLEAGGNVLGDIVALGGLVVLSDNAVVRGDVLVLGAHLEQAEGAQVDGEIISPMTNATTINIPDIPPISIAPQGLEIPGGLKIPQIKMPIQPVFNLVWFMFRVFIWAMLAMLVVIFIPNHTHRIGQVAIGQPITSGGLGLLTIIVAPFILVILAITIILIPVSILGLILLVIAWAMGIIGLGLETGERINMLLKQNWPDVVSAGIGTFFLVLVMNGMREVIPCIGWIVPGVLVMIGIGSVILTRFGSQEYRVYNFPLAPTPPTPPSAPEPPKLSGDNQPS